MTRRLISSGSTFEKEFGYSRAVVDGDWAFVSGTTGFDYRTMEISPAVDAQTAQCFANIEAALKEAGFALADVVRVVIYVASLPDFHVAVPVIGEKLRDIRPANTTVLAGFVDPRIRIEIEATAKRRGA